MFDASSLKYEVLRDSSTDVIASVLCICTVGSSLWWGGLDFYYFPLPQSIVHDGGEKKKKKKSTACVSAFKGWLDEVLKLLSIWTF